MKTPVALMLAVVATTPLTLDLAPARRDSSVTSVMIGAGSGRYAQIARGCNGDVLSKSTGDLGDVGFAVEHAFAGPAVLGVRGGRIDRLDRDFWGYRAGWYGNPYGALEWKYVGYGLGGIVGLGEVGDLNIPNFSAHLRVGNPRGGLALAVRVLEEVPAFTAGGPISAGIGFSPTRRSELWLGVAGGDPYDHAGMFARARFPLCRHLDGRAGIRLGESEGITETGFAVGLTWSAVRH